MRNSFFFLIVGFLFFQGAIAQKEKDSLFLQLNLKFGNEALQMNKNYISKNNDTLQLSTLKFYISNIRLECSDRTILTPKNKYHLVDTERPNSLRFPVCKASNRKFTKISFDVGIDSTASVSGAMSGDLDPANGMYWAWQSGYINFKIEGSSPSCKTRKNAFHFHIGGYLEPNYALRECTLELRDGLQVTVDVAELFAKVKLAETNSVMIPGKKAMELADYSTAMFKTE